MKNIALYASILSLSFLMACKEVGPNINPDPDPVKGEDTTYKTTNVEDPQQKKVLIEEFTGVKCPNCPDGAKILKAISSNNSGNIVIIGYHPANYGLTKPIDEHGIKSKYDFRTQDAADINNNVLGSFAAMPTASIERVYANNSYFLGRGEWSQAVKDRLLVATPVNIHVSSVFDGGSREATVIVRLAYTSDVNAKQNINIAITEDGIIDAQEDGLTIVEDYEHNHVLRDIVTPINGAPIPEKVDPKEAGTIYERTFTIPISTKWNADNCNVVVFITTDLPGDKTVVQSAEIKLK